MGEQLSTMLMQTYVITICLNPNKSGSGEKKKKAIENYKVDFYFSYRSTLTNKSYYVKTMTVSSVQDGEQIQSKVHLMIYML